MITVNQIARSISSIAENLFGGESIMIKTQRLTTLRHISNYIKTEPCQDFLAIEWNRLNLEIDGFDVKDDLSNYKNYRENKAQFDKFFPDTNTKQKLDIIKYILNKN